MNSNYKQESIAHMYLQFDSPMIDSQEKAFKKKTEINSKDQFIQSLLRNVLEEFRGWNWDPMYQSNYLAIRNNQREETIKVTVAYTLFREFICNLMKEIFEKIYGLNRFSDSHSNDDIEKTLKKEYPTLHNDLFKIQTLIATTSVSEVIDKLLDDNQIGSLFCLLSIPFFHPLALKLSIGALAISFFNYKVLLDKNIHDSEENPSFPKITYICFTGYYSEVDIDMIYQYSENVQVIMIYDISTGGPRVPTQCLRSNKGLLSSQDRYEEVDVRLSGHKRVFEDINPNLLLLPLDCSGDTEIASKDIYNLFETVIFPSIQRFVPELIAMSHCFNFHPKANEADDNPVKFSLKPKTFLKIIYRLRLIANNRIVIIPQKPYKETCDVNPREFSINSKYLKEFMEKLQGVYSRPWDTRYFQDCFVGAMEVFSGTKTFDLSKKKRRLTVALNPGLLNIALSLYADHPFYSFLSSSLMKTKAEVTTQRSTFSLTSELSITPLIKGIAAITSISQDSHTILQKDKMTIEREIRRHKSNRIFLFDRKKLPNHKLNDCIVHYELRFDDDSPCYPRLESQYIVDYVQQVIYYFNVWHEGRYCHFKFSFGLEKTSLKGEFEKGLNQYLLQNKKKTLLDFGLCIGAGKIFWVYGQKAVNDREFLDTNTVYYYDIERKEWIEPKIKSIQGILPRHGVTCKYKEAGARGGNNILFVFGGDIETRELDSKRTICNIVEFFKMNFEENWFEHHKLSKDSFQKDQIYYAPYCHSLAYEFHDKIVIMGGKRYVQSKPELNLNEANVFAFNFKTETFEKAKVKVEDSRQDKSLSRTINFASSSINFATVDDAHYGIISSRASESLIFKVVSEYGNIIIQLSSASLNTKEIPFALKKSDAKNNETENSALAEEQKILKQVLEYLRNFSPEFCLVLLLLLQVLHNFIEKGQSLNNSVFCRFMEEILSSPLLKFENNSHIAKALVEICFSLNAHETSKISELTEAICKAIKYDPPDHKFQFKDSRLKENFCSLILADKHKSQLIEFLKCETRLCIEENRITAQTISKAERIFANVSGFKDYYQPTFGEVAQRWCAFDLLNLIVHETTEKIKDYVYHEDTEVLNHLASSIFKVIHFSQKANQTKDLLVTRPNGEKHRAGVQEVLISDIEDAYKNILWNDKGITQVSEKSNLSNNQRFLKNLDVDLLSEQSILKMSCVLLHILIEIAKREGVKLSKISLDENENSLDTQKMKWQNLRQASPKFWDLLISIQQGKGFDYDIENSLQQLFERNKTNSEILFKFDFIERDRKKRHEEKNEKHFVDYYQQEATVEVAPTSDNKGQIISKPEEIQQDETPETTIRDQSMQNCLDNDLDSYSKSNLQIAHQDIGRFHNIKFWLAPNGSEIYGLQETKWLRAKLALYDHRNGKILPFFLEIHQRSSLCLWNAAAFLYCDEKIHKRIFTKPKDDTFKHCIFYSDLSQAFGEQATTKGLVLFSVVLRNEDDLSNRTIVADDQGVFLLGGSKFCHASLSRSPVVLSNKCSYYELHKLKKIGTDFVNGKMEPMQIKRDNLLAVQTAKNIFVMDRMNLNQGKSKMIRKLSIEIYDKLEHCWKAPILIPQNKELELAFCYELQIRMNKDQREEILIFSQKLSGKNFGYFFEIENQEVMENDPRLNELKDEVGEVLKFDTFEYKPFQNNYATNYRLDFAHFHKIDPEVFSFYPKEE